MTTTEIRTTMEQRKGRRFQLEKDLSKTKRTIKHERVNLILHEKAKVIINEVGILTQNQLKFFINDITSLALESIFKDDAYALELEFVKRRERSECDIFFVRNKEKIKPLDSSGGGSSDIASFALRLASWSLQNPKSINTIILDEPFRFLSDNYMDDASSMVKDISEKLKVQFIFVTHEDSLTEHSNKIFDIRLKKGISKIKSIENDKIY